MGLSNLDQDLTARERLKTLNLKPDSGPQLCCKCVNPLKSYPVLDSAYLFNQNLWSTLYVPGKKHFININSFNLYNSPRYTTSEKKFSLLLFQFLLKKGIPRSTYFIGLL